MDETQGAQSSEPTRDEPTKKKFFLAGFCARCFLGKNVKEVLEDITDYISGISKVKYIYCMKLLDATDNSLNHMVSCYEKDRRSLCWVCFHCPSLRGNLLELEFLRKLRCELSKFEIEPRIDSC